MLLQIEDLVVSYRTRAGLVRAVDGVSLSIAAGQSVGLVGESGCGKTTVTRALLRILPPNGVIERGRILLEGVDLTRLSASEMRRVRWRRIAMVPQSAMNALNPVVRVGDQLVETIRIHEHVDAAAAWRRAEDLFERVGIERRRLYDYPHQFSGGMRQRVAIAMAIALQPALLIADEPTTALDVLVQDRILNLLEQLRADLGLAFLYITHDVPVVAELCDAVAVMYAGKIVEFGPLAQVFGSPSHPYTMGLLRASPKPAAEQSELISIPGAPPNLVAPPRGCRFAERCPFADDRCHLAEPPLEAVAPGHLAACHFAADAPRMRQTMATGDAWARAFAGTP